VNSNRRGQTSPIHLVIYPVSAFLLYQLSYPDFSNALLVVVSSGSWQGERGETECQEPSFRATLLLLYATTPYRHHAVSPYRRNWARHTGLLVESCTAGFLAVMELLGVDWLAT
jgi:hypothetical protein